jgi:hypothetical protein
MFRTLMIGAVSALTLSAAAFAQQGGSPQEARAMLDKAIAAVKADPVVAIGGRCQPKLGRPLSFTEGGTTTYGVPQNSTSIGKGTVSDLPGVHDRRRLRRDRR